VIDSHNEPVASLDIYFAGQKAMITVRCIIVQMHVAVMLSSSNYWCSVDDMQPVMNKIADASWFQWCL